MKGSERREPDNSTGRTAEERSRSNSTSAGTSAHFYLPLPNSVETAAVAAAFWQSYRQPPQQLSPEPYPEPSRAGVGARPLGPSPTPGAALMRAATTPESITEEEESAESGGGGNCSGGGVRMEVEDSSAYSTGGSASGSGGARTGSVCSSAPTPQSPQSQWSPLQPHGELQRQPQQRSILRSLLTSAQTHSTTAHSLSPISPARLSPLSPQSISGHSAQSMSAGNSPMTLGPPMSLVRPAAGELPNITLQQPCATAAAEYANFRFSHMSISAHSSAYGSSTVATPLPQSTASSVSPVDERNDRQHRPLKHSFSHTGSLLSSALRGEPVHKTAAICESEADVEMSAAAPLAVAVAARESSGPLDAQLREVCLAKKNLITCTPRIANWLHHCVQFSLSVPAFKAMTRAQQLELLRCSWHRLLVLCMAEHSFHFAVSPVGDARRSAPAAQSLVLPAAAAAAESDASGSCGTARRHSADVPFNPDRNAPGAATDGAGGTGPLPARAPLPRTSVSPGPQPPAIRLGASSGEQPTLDFANALQQLVHKLSNFGLTPVHFGLLKTALLFYAGARIHLQFSQYLRTRPFLSSIRKSPPIESMRTCVRGGAERTTDEMIT